MRPISPHAPLSILGAYWDQGPTFIENAELIRTTGIGGQSAVVPARRDAPPIVEDDSEPADQDARTDAPWISEDEHTVDSDGTGLDETLARPPYAGAAEPVHEHTPRLQHAVAPSRDTMRTRSPTDHAALHRTPTPAHGRPTAPLVMPTEAFATLLPRYQTLRAMQRGTGHSIQALQAVYDAAARERAPLPRLSTGRPKAYSRDALTALADLHPDPETLAFVTNMPLQAVLRALTVSDDTAARETSDRATAPVADDADARGSEHSSAWEPNTDRAPGAAHGSVDTTVRKAAPAGSVRGLGRPRHPLSVAKAQELLTTHSVTETAALLEVSAAVLVARLREAGLLAPATPRARKAPRVDEPQGNKPQLPDHTVISDEPSTPSPLDTSIDTADLTLVTKAANGPFAGIDAMGATTPAVQTVDDPRTTGRGTHDLAGETRHDFPLTRCAMSAAARHALDARHARLTMRAVACTARDIARRQRASVTPRQPVESRP